MYRILEVDQQTSLWEAGGDEGKKKLACSKAFKKKNVFPLISLQKLQKQYVFSESEII